MTAIGPHVPSGTRRLCLPRGARGYPPPASATTAFLAPVRHRFGLLGPKNSRLLVPSAPLLSSWPLGVLLCLTLPAHLALAHAPLNGQWAVERRITSSFEMPIVGLVVQTQTIRALWSISGQPDALAGSNGYSVSEKVCSVNLGSSTPAIKGTLRPGFAAGVSGTTFALDVGVERPGAIRIDVTKVIGAELQHGAALPVSPTDARVRDIDDDGLPGFTVALTGLVTGEIRFVRRERLRFSGKLTSPDRMEGKVAIEFEQRAIAATSSFLLDPIPERIDDARFRARRLGKATTCETLKRQ